MTKFDVVGFGALNVDKLFKVNRIAQAEEESFITAQSETCGGSAANTAVALARLGCKVGFIGKVSSDREGTLQVEELQQEGVDTNSVVQVKKGRSGKVLGFVDTQGARALYIDSGVNDTVALNEIDLTYASQTQFLHLTSFAGEKSFLTQQHLLKKILKNVKVSFDPGACYARKGYVQLAPIIEKSYLLMPNAIELALITGEKGYQKGAETLLAKGVEVVAVKLGGEGCYVTDGHEHHRIEAFKVPVVDTTGAGDAFCAGFLYGLLHNKGLLECGKLGNFVASRCVMQLGARTNLPYKKDLKFLR